MRHLLLIIALLSSSHAYASNHGLPERLKRCSHWASSVLIEPLNRFFHKVNYLYLRNVVTAPRTEYLRAQKLYQQAVKDVEQDAAQKKFYESARNRRTEILLEFNSKFEGANASVEITETTPPDQIPGMIAFQLSEFVLEARAIEWDIKRLELQKQEAELLEKEAVNLLHDVETEEARLKSMRQSDYSFRDFQDVPRELIAMRELARARLGTRSDLIRGSDENTTALVSELVTRFELWHERMMNLPFLHPIYEAEEEKLFEVLVQENQTRDSIILKKIFKDL